MALGPGKYDFVCSIVREHVGMTPDSPGGVIVIVIGGDKGNGFSVQADLQTTLGLPDLLEHMAREIRKSGAF